jgi:hypothetical protein
MVVCYLLSSMTSTRVRTWILVLGGLWGLSCAVPASATNLVLNGDFTNTTLTSPGGYLQNNPVVTDWSNTCSAFGCGGGGTPTSLLFPGTNGAAWNNGNGFWQYQDSPVAGNVIGIDGDPNYTSVLSQTINGLVAGHTYSLSFYQAGAQQAGLFGPTTRYWNVSLGGMSQASASMFVPSQGFAAWQLQTMTFTASMASEVLSFYAVGSPAVPPIALLSGVSLVDSTPTPTPASWALWLSGAGILGVLARHRRRSRTLTQ